MKEITKHKKNGERRKSGTTLFTCILLPTSSFSASGVLTKSTVIHRIGERSLSSSSPSFRSLGRIRDGRAFPKMNVDFLNACIVAEISSRKEGLTSAVSSSFLGNNSEGKKRDKWSLHGKVRLRRTKKERPSEERGQETEDETGKERMKRNEREGERGGAEQRRGGDRSRKAGKENDKEENRRTKREAQKQRKTNAPLQRTDKRPSFLGEATSVVMTFVAR